MIILWKGMGLMNMFFDMISSNQELTLTLLTVLISVFAGLIYSYILAKLKRVIHLEELKIKKDAIKDIPHNDKKDELMENIESDKIINIDILKSMINNELNDKGDFLYKLLNLHHKQALQQSNIQFWFSILASVIGFMLIVLMIFITNNNEWYDYIFKMLPGAIIEIVSVLFINQARETRDRATKFFTELNYEMQISKSVEIADTIENEEIRSDVKSKIALRIIGIDKNLDAK